MNAPDWEKRYQQLNKKTAFAALHILFIFGIPAIFGYFAGAWIDERYQIYPRGSLMALGVTFLFSWALVIRMYRKLSRAHKHLHQEEKRLKERSG